MTRELRQVIRRKSLPQYTGLQRTAIDELLSKPEPEFPEPVPLTDSGRAKAWFSDELALWQCWRQAKRDRHTPLTWKQWFQRHRDEHDCKEADRGTS